MLQQRILSILIGVPILLGFLFFGRIAFFALVVVLILAGLDEFYSMTRKLGKRPVVLLGMMGGVLFATSALFKGEGGLAVTVTWLLMLLLTAYFLGVGPITLSDVGVTLFGSLYVGLLFSYLILIRGMSGHGVILVLLVFIATWVYDIVAYVAGKAIGRTKLAPIVSPGKSWEGALIAALVTVLALAVLYMIPWFPLGKRVVFGLLIGVVAPFGDLAESKLKREAKIKDMSSRIPGHGGVLDRFDSLLFIAPISYYFFKAIF